MYLVNKTLHYTDTKTGEKQVIVASSKPQDLPKPLVKEALARGLAVKAEVAEPPEVAVKPESSASDDETESSADDDSDSAQ